MGTICAAAIMALHCLLPAGAAADSVRAGGEHRTHPTAPADAWLAEDKIRHFTMSYGIVAFGYGSARAIGVDDRSALAAAVTAAATAGLLKEVYDRATGGIFSYRDLVWDAAGVLAGVAVVRRIR